MKNPERAIISILAGLVAALAFLLLTACHDTVEQDRPVTVRVPVPAPCATKRPAPIPSLQDRADWDSLDIRQKTALVSKQAVELRTYGEQLQAATGACK